MAVDFEDLGSYENNLEKAVSEILNDMTYMNFGVAKEKLKKLQSFLIHVPREVRLSEFQPEHLCHLFKPERYSGFKREIPICEDNGKYKWKRIDWPI